MRIQHNLSAMNSLSSYHGNNKALSGNLEKLSSGYRINSAADDAAGLAISEKMRSQIAGLEKAQDNANDGISLVQTAEGALTEVNSMLTRLTTLATQSANGTYEDGVDRVNLQEETDALLSEMDRISKSTNFNGINLLDGSLSGAGGAHGAVKGAKIASFKPAKQEGAAFDASAASAVTLGKETFVVDGATATVDWGKLSADDQGKLKLKWDTNTSKAAGDEAAKIMQDTINSAFKDAGFNTSVEVTASTGAGGTKFTIKSKDETGQSSINILKNGDGGSQTADNKTIGTKLFGMTQGTAVAGTHTLANGADMSGKFNMNINGTDYAIQTTGLNAGSTGSQVAAALKTAIDATIDAYNGSVTEDLKLDKSQFTVDFTNDGRISVQNGSDAKIGFNDIKGFGVAKALGISNESSNVSGNGLTLQVGDTNKDYQKVTVSIDDMSSKGLGLSNLSVANQDSAGAAIDTIKAAVNKVSTQRGKLGALQNRLDHTLKNLDSTTQNITAAESQIRDVDMAKEMTKYSKNNILVQASQSMLAQANSMPQGVLSLLR